MASDHSTTENGDAIQRHDSGREVIRWKSGLSSESVCPVCKSAGEKTFLLDVRNPLVASEYLSVYRCQECGTSFYSPFVQLPKDDYYTGRLIKYVCETAWGIDSVILPLIVVQQENLEGTLLDVGCGLGLSVDFGSRMLGWEAVGVEPSPLGNVGRSSLDAPIYADYLENVRELEGKRFGVVYASEVIEHVQDPISLIRTLARFVSDRGILLLTTPNADYLRPETNFPVNVIILSPGDHMVLFTPDQLMRVLKDLGFPYTSLLRNDSQMSVCASYQPLRIHEGYLEHVQGTSRDYYHSYLEKLGALHIGDPFLANGISYRRFVGFIERGLFAEAQQFLDTWRPQLCAQYGDSVLDPHSVCQQVHSVSSISAFIDRFPGPIAGLHHYMGLMSLRARHDYDHALQHFTAASEITRHCAAFSFDYFTEDLLRLWDAQYQLGHCFLGLGRTVEAIGVFQKICRQQDFIDPDSAFSSPRQELVHHSSYFLGLALIRENRFEEAITQFRKVLSLERERGWSGLSGDAAAKLGQATGRILKQELEALSDRRHACGNLERAFYREVGTLLNRSHLWKLAIQQAARIVTHEGFGGIAARVRKRIS